MNLLAFDASGSTAGIAVFAGGKRLYCGETPAAGGRKENLHAEIAAAMKKARLDFSRLDAVAVGLGPGSFTGLRIAVTAAKTLAWSAGLKLFGYSTLEAVAASQGLERVTVTADAGRGNVYTAAYAGRPGRSWRVAQKPRLEKRTPSHRLTDVISPAAVAGGLVELTLKNPSRGKADPFRLEPLYLYPRDCNVTLA